jgi:hypothetical protein
VSGDFVNPVDRPFSIIILFRIGIVFFILNVSDLEITRRGIGLDNKSRSKGNKEEGSKEDNETHLSFQKISK